VRDFIDCIRSSIGYALRLRREINELGYKLQQSSRTQFDADVVRTFIPIAEQQASRAAGTSRYCRSLKGAAGL
jgi:hypothetical protein